MSGPTLYDDFLARSKAMVAAAIAQDWHALAEHARQRDILENEIRRQRALSRRPLTPHEEATFRQVLALDQEVRDRVEPWLKHTGKLLSRWSVLRPAATPAP